MSVADGAPNVIAWINDSREKMMAGDELFGKLPTQTTPQEKKDARGAPRMREPVRDQIELRAVDIDSLIGQGDPVRVIWAYVEPLDLSEVEDRIEARDNAPGHPATSPRLMVALWLYATSQGVGSARALARLCESHDAYRWLCGGVSVNYHTLADFRIGCADLLDRLLTEHVTALAEAGIIDLAVLAQDGVRVRASAGAASFRREVTLEQRLAAVGAMVEELKREVDEHPDASNQRIKAARQRAARERRERIVAAQQTLCEIKAQRQEREETHGKPSMVPTRSSRVATTGRACWPGAPGWRARREKRTTSAARSASASMPAGEAGTSSKSACEASKRLQPWCSGSRLPTTFFKATASPPHRNRAQGALASATDAITGRNAGETRKASQAVRMRAVSAERAGSSNERVRRNRRRCRHCGVLRGA